MSEHFLVFSDPTFSHLVTIINIILAFCLIYFEHNEPSVTWAWLLVLFMLPIIGFFIYLLFGLDGKKSSMYIKKQINDKKIFDKIFSLDYDGLKFLHMHENKVLVKEYLGLAGAKKFQKLVTLNYKTNFSVISMNNHVELFFQGEQLFTDIINEINNAKSHIHLQSYIIKNDYLGDKITDALINATNRGVEVKVLTDKIGSLFLDREIVKTIFKNNSIETTFFPMFTKLSINLRNHRKILIIDGKFGYIGGFNIGKEYLGRSKRFGNWRDAHVKIMGDSVKMLEISFIKDWNSSPKCTKINLDEKYFPVVEKSESFNNKIQIVQSGPDTKYRNIELAYVYLINSAQRSIHIVTPYFTPERSLLVALKNAILSGIKVTIMIPKNPDHPFVFGASISHIRELIDLGANCYAYDDGFVHSKILVVDESVSSIGSANFDARSFKLNFEITAFIYSHYTAKNVITQINKDIEKSVKMTEEFYKNRPKSEKIKESFSRLLSPLL